MQHEQKIIRLASKNFSTYFQSVTIYEVMESFYYCNEIRIKDVLRIKLVNDIPNASFMATHSYRKFFKKIVIVIAWNHMENSIFRNSVAKTPTGATTTILDA